MAIIAGIDEAGVGSVIGPMVATAVALEVPDAWLGMNHWQTLSAFIAPAVKQNELRLVVADSKKLSQRDDGLQYLERAALTLLALAGDAPPNLPATCAEALAQLCPAAAHDLCHCPWYGDGVELPVACDQAALRLGASVLARGLAKLGCRVRAVASQVYFEPTFNGWVERTHNKANVCWQQTSTLLSQAVDTCQSTWVTVDRQGGRRWYLDRLLLLFSGVDVRVLEESAERSAYDCQLASDRGPRRCCIEFTCRAEQASLAVAWASCVSKYVRELYMHRMNRFFVGHQSDLKPTAGYHPDGLRFVRDVAPTLEKLGLREEAMIRVR